MRFDVKKTTAMTASILMIASMFCSCGKTAADEASSVIGTTTTTATTKPEIVLEDSSEDSSVADDSSVAEYEDPVEGIFKANKLNGGKFENGKFVVEVGDTVKASDVIKMAIEKNASGESWVSDSNPDEVGLDGSKYSEIRFRSSKSETKKFDKLGDFTEEVELRVTHYSEEAKKDITLDSVMSIPVKVQDTTPPQIMGAHDWEIDLSDKNAKKVDFHVGVGVLDNSGESINLEIDSSEVKLEKEGTYKLTYKAVDSSNNPAEKVVSVVVTKKEATTTTKKTETETEEEQTNNDDGGNVETYTYTYVVTEPPTTQPTTQTTTQTTTQQTTTQPPVTEPPTTSTFSDDEIDDWFNDPDNWDDPSKQWCHLYGDPLGLGYEYWYWWNCVTGEIVLGVGHP